MSAQYIRFSARAATERRRSPLLERLLAGADAFTPVVDWRHDAFRVIAPQAASMPGLGAAALCADRGAVSGAWVLLATPVHYVAEMSNVRLAADGILSLGLAEGDSLCGDFNRVWHDAGIRLTAARSGDLFCIVDRPLPATTQDPDDARGQHIHQYLPSGPGAPRLRQFMSEIEMWLFDHPVNRDRTAAALPVITGLWLWGGGAVLESLPVVSGWAAGNDPFFKAFAGEVASGAGVVVIAEEPGSDRWSDVEADWLHPALEQLRAGRLLRLDLSAGHRCISISRRWSLRFWRRRRPWWESFV